jgi:hypothetical protein
VTTATASPTLTIAEAQRDVRTIFLGGFAGQLVSGLIWLASAALGVYVSTKSAIITLVLGGFFIFPLTQMLLRVMGRRASLPKGHPMNALAIQIAFIVGFCLPLVDAATLYHLNWFYPALMIVVGAHYLPFTFLYGMRQFLALGCLLIGAGVLIGLCLPMYFTPGAWITGALLLIFAFTGRRAAIVR